MGFLSTEGQMAKIGARGQCQLWLSLAASADSVTQWIPPLVSSLGVA